MHKCRTVKLHLILCACCILTQIKCRLSLEKKVFVSVFVCTNELCRCTHACVYICDACIYVLKGILIQLIESLNALVVNMWIEGAMVDRQGYKSIF